MTIPTLPSGEHEVHFQLYSQDRRLVGRLKEAIATAKSKIQSIDNLLQNNLDENTRNSLLLEKSSLEKEIADATEAIAKNGIPFGDPQVEVLKYE